MEVDSFEAEITESLYFRFDFLKILIKRLEEILLLLIQCLTAQKIGADFDCCEGIIEFMTNRHNELTDRLGPLFSNEHSLLVRAYLLLHPDPLEDVQDSTRKH